MFILTTILHTPVFFGLFYTTKEVELGTFDTWNDAVGYAYNVCGFKHDYAFTVTKQGE